MDLKSLEALITLLRNTGVNYIKTSEVELFLGPQVPIFERPEPERPREKIVAPIKDENPGRRVNSLLDHPALWGGGSRPTD